MQTRYLLLAVLLLALPFRLAATHIVGGELEMTHRQGTTYQLRLIQYFDAVNGNPGALDQDARIDIYTKEHVYVESFVLPLVSDTRVEYTSPACAIGSLSTRRLVYSLVVTLTATRYTNPTGYYMVYDRCCRNGVIRNIRDPGAAAMAFYLEFPPLIRNGQPFINSSPRLFPPLSDYACINTPFYFDFSGEDPDGDQIVYSLQTPINGNSSQSAPRPAPSPGPFPRVQFLSGYSVQNMIRGNPPLRVDAQTGLLTITPSELGLFVFSVLAEEFRNGEKIGEVRRDFQMLVIDCPRQDPPEITGILKNDGSALVPGEIPTYVAGQSGNCLTFRVTDPNPNTRISTRIIPRSHPSVEVEVRGNISGTLQPGQALNFQVCLKECTSLANEVYEFDLLVGDNSCAVPLFDTARVQFNVIRENLPPVASSDLVFNPQSRTYSGRVAVDETLTFRLLGQDPDGDPLRLTSLLPAAEATRLGLSSGATIANIPGRLEQSFSIAPTCALFGATETPGSRAVSLAFLLEDLNQCGAISADTIRLNLIVDYTPRPNNIPVLLSEDLPGSASGFFARQFTIGDSVGFRLTGTDADADFVRIRLVGVQVIEGALSERAFRSQITFNPVEGIAPQQTFFGWRPDCQSLGENSGPARYLLTFLLEEQLPCLRPRSDTLQVEIAVADLEQPALAVFPNAFTPNGDGIGDSFRLPNLPLDDCRDRFRAVRIFNRWGQEVFSSHDRNFSWEAEGFPPGQYYYLVQYENQEFKGYLRLLRE